MNRKIKIAIFAFLLLGVAGASLLYLASLDLIVLNAKGLIGVKQQKLFLISSALMLLIIVPVFFISIYVTWKYRASNRTAKYEPDWDQSILAETIWWGVPFIIIVVLSVLTWKSSHELDPFRPIDSKEKPINIQVVALQWKWLFIYPEQQIATVNYIRIPEKRPINFVITSDAPMNSFWIPQLGGQIYAMSGMRSQLHLIADEKGVYRGSSAHLSGSGFAAMNFIVESTSQDDFDQWAASTNESSSSLSYEDYKSLAKPSEEKQIFYRLKDQDLFDRIVAKYMTPQT